jgi:hypothetical protein
VAAAAGRTAVAVAAAAGRTAVAVAAAAGRTAVAVVAAAGRVAVAEAATAVAGRAVARADSDILSNEVPSALSSRGCEVKFRRFEDLSVKVITSKQASKPSIDLARSPNRRKAFRRFGEFAVNIQGRIHACKSLTQHERKNVHCLLTFLYM